ncbi:dihydropyrimidinase-like [Triticum aestivum]|uniref:dihydropyrimidinase-like n=2 Tax=Triticinae TaxID=1648030 RepID=UPI001D0090D8|nr:dihydropyrimidinase-like [Triticum aestivum]
MRKQLLSYSMHIDFVIPVNGNLTAGLESYEHKAEKAAMDYGFHMAITKWNDEVSREMEVMVKEHGGCILSSAFLDYSVHDEHPRCQIFSSFLQLEGEATSREIRLAKFVNTTLYVVHVMSTDAMEEIAKAKREGQRVIGEPVVSGLVLDDSWLWDPDFATASKYVMSPPIREAGHNKALQAALSSGILQLVGTDHCTFNSTQKAFGSDDFRKIPNGVNGIEERMHIIWDSMVETGKITVTDYVRVTSTECAKIFNIYPRKGAILEGSDADIIILNPKRSFAMGTRTHHSRSDTNVYEGRKGKGMVEVTISRGRVVWEDGLNKGNCVLSLQMEAGKGISPANTTRGIVQQKLDSGRVQKRIASRS